jgi:serine protease Do
LRRDRRRKLALLKITANTPQHFKLSQEPIGQKGDWVVAVSNAFRVADKDEPLSVMMGIVSLRTSIQARLNTRDVAYEGDLILIDAITSNPGAGGGAVLDADGRLIGMIGKIINSSETNTRLNYAVPTPTLYRFVNEKLVAKQAVEKSQPRNPTENIDLGIRIFRLGGKRDPAYVDRVVSKSPAAVAGLKPDDLIVSVGGEKIGTVRQYDQVIALPQDSHEIVVVVKRGKKLLRFILKLAEPSS